MAASKQVSKHTHAHAQCSNASVGLAQARPKQMLFYGASDTDFIRNVAWCWE